MKWSDIPEFISCNYAVDYPICDIIRLFIDCEIENNGLQMNPDFQRGNVWTASQQCAYIEFLLREGKSGRDLYFNDPAMRGSPIDGYTDFVCVDGLQRITAIRRFCNDEIKAFGLKRSEFEGRLGITNTVRVHINSLKTKAEVLQWYLEMNSGGTVHSSEELKRVKALLDEENKILYQKEGFLK